MDGEETLDVLAAADLFGESIDDNGYMPGDADYQEPEAEEPEVEEEKVEQVEEESEEDDPEEDDSEEDEPVEKPAEETEEPLFEIEIGEDVYEVNAEELKAGYLRNEELIGRTTKLEKEHTEKLSALAEKELQVEQELDALLGLQHHELGRFQNVNWAELKLIDPDQYKELRSEFHEAKERTNMFLARKQEINRMRTEAEKLKHQSYLAEQHRLVAQLVPEFKDESFQKELIQYGEKIGYSEDELRNIADARHLMLLNQARLYEKSQLKRKEALEKKVPKEVPKVLKPGAPQAVSKAKTKAVQASAQSLKSTGSINAARDYFLNAGFV